jgi:hypothetical protein
MRGHSKRRDMSAGASAAQGEPNLDFGGSDGGRRGEVVSSGGACSSSLWRAFAVSGNGQDESHAEEEASANSERFIAAGRGASLATAS